MWIWVEQNKMEGEIRRSQHLATSEVVVIRLLNPFFCSQRRFAIVSPTTMTYLTNLT